MNIILKIVIDIVIIYLFSFFFHKFIDKYQYKWYSFPTIMILFTGSVSLAVFVWFI